MTKRMTFQRAKEKLCGYIFKLQYYFGIANDGTVNK